MVRVILMLQLLCGTIVFASDVDTYDSSQEVKELFKAATESNPLDLVPRLNHSVFRVGTAQRANSSTGNSEIVSTIEVATQVPSPEKEKDESEATSNCWGCCKGVFNRFMKK